MAWDLGDTVRVPVVVIDAAGQPADATSLPTAAVTRPDSTTFLPAPPVVDDPGTGLYHFDVVPDAANWGPWTWTVNATGTGFVFAHSGQFFVRAPGPRIVSLEEAKNHLNKNQSVTTDDDELRDWIDATRWVIEHIKGAVVPRTVVEYRDGGRRAITMRTGPVISVTEVREIWGPGDVRILTQEPDTLVGATENDYTVDIPLRRLLRRNNGTTSYWPYGQGNIRVTYRVGRTAPEANIHNAGLELITHFWRASQFAVGASRPREGTPDVVALSYGVPNRVRELLGPRRAPRLGG